MEDQAGEFSLFGGCENKLTRGTSQGRPFNHPPTNSNLGYSGSFLYMLDHLNEKNYQPHPVFVKALDVLFLLHADHELNCSTAAMLVRLILCRPCDS